VCSSDLGLGSVSPLDKAGTTVGKFEGEMVSQAAGVVDSLQTPVGIATALLGGPILGKIAQWSPKLASGLTRLAGAAFTGTKAVDTLGDVADVASAPDPKNVAKLVTDAGLTLSGAGLSLLGRASARTSPTASVKTEPPPGAPAPPAPSTVAPPPLPGGTKALPASSNPSHELWGQMPMEDLLKIRNSMAKQIPALYGETNPYTKTGQRTQANVGATKQLEYIDKIIKSRGGPPASPAKAPEVSKEPMDLRNAPKVQAPAVAQPAPQPQRALPPGAPPAKQIGASASPKGLPAPAEQTQYGPQTADVPNQLNNVQARRIGEKHDVHPDFVLNASRASNQELIDAVNQMTVLRAKLSVEGDMTNMPAGSERPNRVAGQVPAGRQAQTQFEEPSVQNSGKQGAPLAKHEYIDQLTRHINALSDMILQRDKIPPGGSRGK
jgi:hypothetical protein